MVVWEITVFSKMTCFFQVKTTFFFTIKSRCNIIFPSVYVDEVLEIVQKKNADQPEFLQAVTEVLDSLRPVIDANEELYRKNAILERITEPDRQIIFRVPWVDENDK